MLKSAWFIEFNHSWREMSIFHIFLLFISSNTQTSDSETLAWTSALTDIDCLTLKGLWQLANLPHTASCPVMTHKRHPKSCENKVCKVEACWLMCRTRWHQERFFFLPLRPLSSPPILCTLFSHSNCHHRSHKSPLCSSCAHPACHYWPQ